jgi:drug/metabolite transporter (DMT)-like permease
MADPAPQATSVRILPTAADSMRGIVVMLLGFFLYSAADALAKYLTTDFPPLQISFTRQIGLTLFVLILIATRGPGLLRTRQPGRQLARGAMAAVSSASFIIAVTYVPLADAVAVAFISPFIATALAALFLGEAVGIRRWAAIGVGLVGTLIVIRPGFGVFHPAIALAFVSALALATRQVLSRSLGPREATQTTLAYTALTATALLAVPLPFVWTAPTTLEHWGLFAVLAVLAAGGEFCFIRALELAGAVSVAPVMYSVIIWSTLWGFLLFDQLPDGWTIVGAGVVVASGIYSFYRETRAMRRAERNG